MIPICIFSLLLSAAAARCMPGIEWQVAGSFDDFGADSFTTAYLNISFLDALQRFHSVKAEAAKFGDGPAGPASGVLVHVVSPGGSHTGCETPLTASYGQIPISEPWIALVQRGQCNFEVKVENAFRQNAAAVIVYNDRESTTLDKMKLNSGSRNISAVFTFKWKGEELARLADGGSRVFVQISVATHCTRPSAHINRTSVLFVSISFIVLMIISLAWLVFYYIQRFRYVHAKDRLSKRLCSAAKKALSKIPTKQIAGEDKEVLGDECCAVCIEPYRVTDDLRILPCKHEFHKGCIDPWLLEHRTCPMCKMDILKHYGFVFTGSQESILQVEDDRPDSRERHDPQMTMKIVVGWPTFDDSPIRCHAGSRSLSNGVRSEPVSRVATPTLHIQGQFYTIQPAHTDDCCSIQSCSRSGSTCCVPAIHHPRPVSCHPDLDRAKLLLDGEAYCNDSPQSGPSSSSSGSVTIDRLEPSSSSGVDKSLEKIVVDDWER